MSRILNGELVHYIDVKGNPIAAQVASQRDEPVTKTIKVAVIGGIDALDKTLTAVRGEAASIREGEVLTVIQKDSEIIRGTFEVRYVTPERELGFLQLPAGTVPGDILARKIVVHDEPILTLTYPDPATKVPQTKYDVVHFTHPSKDETNPALPRIVLHAWKRLDEEHIRPAADHPLNDHPFAVAKTDEQGRVIPKARPLHDAQAADHLAGLPDDDRGAVVERERQQAGKVAEHEIAHQEAGLKPTGKEKQQAQSTPREHHPGNPDTVHYSFTCVRCQQPIIRVASHQGGGEFNPEAVNGEWVKHSTTCTGVPPPAAVEPVKAEEEPAAPVHPLLAHEGEITLEDMAKSFPVLSALYDAPDVASYRGVEAKLPNGHTHVVKANGIDQDFKDALTFVHANGFKTHLQHGTLAQFRRDQEAAAALAACAMKPTGTAIEGKPEPDVIAELEKAPPAPSEIENKPEDAA